MVDFLTASLMFALLVFSFSVSAGQRIITAEPGDNVILTCRAAENKEVISVHWKRTDLESDEYVLLYIFNQFDSEGQSPSFSNRVSLLDVKNGDVSLVLKNVTTDDTGRYECRVVQRGMNRSKRFLLGGDPISTVYLIVGPDRINITAKPGDNVILPCRADENKDVRILVWRRTDLESGQFVLLYRDWWLYPERRFRRPPSFRKRVSRLDVKNGDMSLVLKIVKTNDTGIYVCQVFERGKYHRGIQKSISIINLRVKPGHGIITAEPGDNVNLTCRAAENKTIIVVKWSRTDLESGQYVLLYKDKKFNPEGQSPSFRNRVDLLDVMNGDVSLVLKNVTTDDTGTYECRVVQEGNNQPTIKNTKPISTIPLRVEAGQRIITAEPGDNVILTCRAAENKDVIVVKWSKADLESDQYVLVYRGSQFDPEGQSPSFRNRVDLLDVKNGDVSLVLKNVTTDDTGTYECRVVQEGNNQPTIKNTKPISTIPLRVEAGQRNITAEPGDNVILTCRAAENKDVIVVEWSRTDLESDEHVLVYKDSQFYPDGQSPSFEDRVSLLDVNNGDMSLVLKNVTTDDTGTYECRVVQRGNNRRERSLLDTEPISIINLRVEPGQRIFTAEPGDNVILTCRAAEKQDVIVVEWNRTDLESDEYVLVYRDKKLNPGAQSLSFRNRVDLLDVENRDVSLVLKNVTTDDTGTYECRVVQRGNNRRKRSLLDTDPICIINLKVKPGQRNITAEPGDNVILTCRAAENKDVIVVEWSRTDLESDQHVLLYRDKKLNPEAQSLSFRNRVDLLDVKNRDVSLVLKNVTTDDTGRYECRVVQRGNNRRKRSLLDTEPICIINLRVEAGQRIIRAEPGDNVILTCRASENKDVIVVEWSRTDLESDQYVLLYRDSQFYPDGQSLSFRNGVDLLDVENGDVSLVLKNVTTDDTGTYECRVVQGGKNERNILITEPICIINLRVEAGQRIITAEPGDNVILTCRAAENKDVIVVEWSRTDLESDQYVLAYRDSQFFPEGQSPSFRNRVDLLDVKNRDVSLVLKNVTTDDTGRYECRVVQRGNNRRERSLLDTEPICIINLRVEAGQRIIRAEPGDNVILTCRAAENKDVIVVEWSRTDLESDQYVLLYRDRQFFPEGQSPSFINRVDLLDVKNRDVSLVLKNVTTDDTGTYECRVVQRGNNRRERSLLDTEPICIINLRVEAGNKEDGGNKDGPKEDGGNKDGPKEDGGNKDGPKEDGGNKDGPKEDGGNKDGPKEDGGNNDGPKEDGGNKDGQKEDGGNKDGPKEEGRKRAGLKHQKVNLSKLQQDCKSLIITTNPGDAFNKPT
ncbi:obscurin-like [Fundulus diaphanus]